MKAILTSQVVVIPEGVTVELASRTVKITGARGTLQKNFNHVAVEITRQGKNKLKVGVWFGNRAHVACIRTVCSHIKNMITGVTKGYQYKMRAAYSHFPISVSIVDGKKAVEIRNYLGEKIVRRIQMIDGVTIDTTDQKDEIVLRGASLDAVSQSAATIQQVTSVKNKDVRKFLDGIYVSERSNIVRD